MAIKDDLFSCRLALAVMVISGMMSQYMLRTNISIAIVDMIADNSTSRGKPDVERQNWTETDKNELLGAFFWGYLCTNLLGGHLSEIYGTKIVYGIGMLLASVFTLLTPLAAHLHYLFILIARVLTGMSLGVTMPSLPPMAAKWVPPADRAKFMAHVNAILLGIAFTLSVCGLIIEYKGWPYVFYFTGAIGLVWQLFWFFLVYDSPQVHPRISPQEKAKLLSAIPTSFKAKTTTPWRQIITSMPVWAIVVGSTCGLFTFFLVITQLPSYMSHILKFEIRQNGFMSSCPFILGYLAALSFSIIADRLYKRKTYSVVNIRRILGCVLFGGAALVFSVQSIWGYNWVVSIVVFTLATCCYGAFPASVYTNTLDIGPNYAGTIYGFANTVAAVSGYVGTKIVAVITTNHQDFQHWQYIFWIVIGVNLFGLVFFLCFASGEIQSWHPQLGLSQAEVRKINEVGEEI